MSVKRGRCLCGAVKFEYTGEENWRAHCHCESCRRQTSSPFTTFMGVPDGAYRFIGEAPKTYVSSPGVRRLFCRTCGSPVAYDADAFPDEIHFYVASLETPETFSPDFHVHTAEQLPWIHLDDGLPRHPRNIAASAERVRNA